MRWAALMVGFSTLPAFALLPYGGEIYILSVRIWIVLWGVIFACPMMYWIRQNLPVQERYNLSAIGHTLGSALLGRNTVAFALGLYALIPHVVAPALYLTLLAWGAFFAVKKPAT